MSDDEHEQHMLWGFPKLANQETNMSGVETALSRMDGTCLYWTYWKNTNSVKMLFSYCILTVCLNGLLANMLRNTLIAVELNCKMCLL